MENAKTETAPEQEELDLKVAVILVNYNNEGETQNCIRSLLNAAVSGINLEVIVVDNSDRTPISNLDNARILRPGKNLGLSPAWALACEEDRVIKSDYVAFLNNDVVVGEDFFTALKLGTVRWGRTSAFGARIYYRDDPQRIWSRGGTINPRWVIIDHHDCDKKAEDVIPGDFETGHISGCCMLIPTLKLFEVGGPDPNFFFRGEEWDLNYRLIQNGTPLIILDEMTLWHHVNASHDRFHPGMLYLAYRAKVLFARKHHSIFWFPIWFLVGLLYAATKAPKKFASLSGRPAQTLRKPLIDAFFDGLKMLTITPKHF